MFENHGIPEDENGGNTGQRSSSVASRITSISVFQCWNHPKSNIFKTSATFWSFFVMGGNDSAYGLETYYNLSYVVVSLVFLSPLVGYIIAAFVVNRLIIKVGQRGLATISSGCHLVAYILNCIHPPYPVLVVSFIFAGLGNGLADSAWNAWIGNMKNSNQLLGLLHGCYGIGAVISPLVASFMIADAELPWYYFYYIMIGGAAIELVWCVAAFWDSKGGKSGFSSSQSSEHGPVSIREVLFQNPSARVTWICAIFLLGYVGVEVALGGWIVTFMREVRHGAKFASSMTSTGFWLGIAIGRVVLGFVTPLVGEKLAITIYIVLEVVFGVILYQVPNFYAGAVAVSLQGFFLGPLFPSVVVATTKLLPSKLHVSAIGFAAAFGGSGAAILPFAVGAIAQAKGVSVLLPFILGLSSGILILWQGLPRIPKTRENSNKAGAENC
ncbi:hypothetical protein N7462_010925 [Penicillium macrosclerotiorum]|uniref:uncharacterized protein n=1 Tax=Penicillium macrosclerotiorum TaxID=303699 RepID=UPI0025490300|nr:uncharacterized protein N7462_010925 [Penicillium macrosclerotiorum]KAJ5669855.1 hypothetical protein N7462_010925 [Penicillium macrosclerotiorum]